MDDTKAIESLTHEMELTRHEMAALTDALARLSNTMQDTAAVEWRLVELIEEPRGVGNTSPARATRHRLR